MRQIADEADRIRHRDVNARLDVELSGGGVERGEQLVGHVARRACHAIE